MKGYEKPEIKVGGKVRNDKIENRAGGVCPKKDHPYTADWTCASCKHCIHQEGWSWLNNRCDIA